MPIEYCDSPLMRRRANMIIIMQYIYYGDIITTYDNPPFLIIRIHPVPLDRLTISRRIKLRLRCHLWDIRSNCWERMFFFWSMANIPVIGIVF